MKEYFHICLWWRLSEKTVWCTLMAHSQAGFHAPGEFFVCKLIFFPYDFLYFTSWTNAFSKAQINAKIQKENFSLHTLSRSHSFLETIYKDVSHENMLTWYIKNCFSEPGGDTSRTLHAWWVRMRVRQQLGKKAEKAEKVFAVFMCFQMLSV